MSLVLGVLVVLFATILVFTFARNQAQRSYDKINTAVSTHQEEAESPAVSQPKTYEIKKGDNLWKIAENVYGSGYNWVDLAKANNLQNPGLIHVGNKLLVPNVPKITVATVQPTQSNNSSISSDSYKVQKGDNLWNISIRKYGDGFKWPEIVKANNISNPNLIYPDNVLKLPK